MPARCERRKEPSFDLRPGVGERPQPLEMRIPVPASGPRLRLAGKEVKQALANMPSIELKGLMLIAEAHQALVTRGVAVGVCVISRFVEVAPPETLASNPADRVRLLDQSTEYPRAAFGGL